MIYLKNKNFWRYAMSALLAAFLGVATGFVVINFSRITAYAVTGKSDLSYTAKTAPAAVAPAAVATEIDIGNIGATPVFIPPAKGKVIRVDLSAMKLSLYENGHQVAVIDILSRGRPGTPWETPAGEYAVLLREENHFSSIGNVWMPWSLQFFGNFFIHGWPYDESGEPVPTGYSGGCIRLSTPAAKQVYAFADVGTRVSVYGPNDSAAAYAPRLASNSFFLLNQPKPLNLSTKSYLVADLETGEVILEEEMKKIFPIASVSKLMTALISLEVLDQNKFTTVSKKAASTPGTTGKLHVGERIKIGELLYPLLLESGNDAAEALAEAYGRNNFIKAMNDKAGAIGLSSTFFAEPTGLSADNTANAYDLAKLAHYLSAYKKHIFDVSNLSSYETKTHTWRSLNIFEDNELDYLGGKIGFTDEARQTGVAIFSVPFVGGADRPIVVVLLQSEDRKGDLRKLIDYLKRHVFYGPENNLPF